MGKSNMCFSLLHREECIVLHSGEEGIKAAHLVRAPAQLAGFNSPLTCHAFKLGSLQYITKTSWNDMKLSCKLVSTERL